MNTDLELIEQYLTGQLNAGDRSRFETSLRTDPAVAEALAFYVLTRETAKNEARSQRKAELDLLRHRSLRSTDVRPVWSASPVWLAAASVVLLLGLGWYFFGKTTDSSSTDGSVATRLADEYIGQHFDQLTVTMGGMATKGPSTDSLPLGVQLFNEHKLTEAGAVFEQILSRQPENDRALTYAGIVSLRQGDYDTAIDRFHRLSQRTDLFANPGLFLEALAHLKRDLPMDKEQAQKLLTNVVSSNLEGKSEAIVLLQSL